MPNLIVTCKVAPPEDLAGAMTQDSIEANVQHVIDYDDALTAAGVEVTLTAWEPSERECRAADECVTLPPQALVDPETGALVLVVDEVESSSLLPGHVSFPVALGTLYIDASTMLVVVP